MINNDVLRSIRYALDLGDAKVVEIVKLAGGDIAQSDLANFLKKEDEEGFVECGDGVVLSFLDGLIIHKRGKMESRPEQDKKPASRLTNNTILKKLRVAFELKEEGMHKVLELAGFSVSKPELSALFRTQGHKNYRACGDQLLRNFLKGLTIRHRG
ncbi:MAG: YehS family protein [Sulfuricella sp.]